jgi:hypothetical protein
MNRPALRVWLLSAIAFCSIAVPASAEISFLGVGTLPGDTADLSGLEGTYADGMPRNRLGGIGSGIAYTGSGNAYLMVADSGPKEAKRFECRFHAVEIVVDLRADPVVRPRLVATTLLKNSEGRTFVGDPAAFDKAAPFDLSKSLRLDPEGIRAGRDGSVFISDEFGPYILQFDRQGRLLRSLPVPPRFLPANPSHDHLNELPPHSLSGRMSNHGFEGLAISADGGKLYGMMQAPLIQDGALGAKGERLGMNCRLLEMDVTRGKTREFVYQLEHPHLNLCEILAVGGTEFLVIERDSKEGKDAKAKHLYRIDIKNATDVSGVDTLPAKGLPKDIRPVAKKLFLDVLDPRLKVIGKGLPEKFEGMAFGSDLPDGRRLLLLTVDNDFHPTVPIRIFAFAIDRNDLPNFTPQQFDRAKK